MGSRRGLLCQVPRTSSYRQRLRLDQARRRLGTTDLSISEIAFDAGYEHASNFATAFKRTFGFSPKEARANPLVVQRTGTTISR